jgi:hypothetical protein
MPSTPLVSRVSPTFTSALAATKRSSIWPSRRRPKAAARCCVRALSTGMVASRSASSVLGRQQVDPRHLAQHAVLVHHGHAFGHALLRAAVDDELARRVGAS